MLALAPLGLALSRKQSRLLLLLAVELVVATPFLRLVVIFVLRCGRCRWSRSLGILEYAARHSVGAAQVGRSPHFLFGTRRPLGASLVFFAKSAHLIDDRF